MTGQWDTVPYIGCETECYEHECKNVTINRDKGEVAITSYDRRMGSPILGLELALKR